MLIKKYLMNVEQTFTNWYAQILTECLHIFSYVVSVHTGQIPCQSFTKEKKKIQEKITNYVNSPNIMISCFS